MAKREFSDYVDNFVRQLPCVVPTCIEPRSDPDHVPTVGSQGRWHEQVWNLCRRHHTERHAIGLDTFLTKHNLGSREDLDVYLVELRKVYERLVASGRWQPSTRRNM